MLFVILSYSYFFLPSQKISSQKWSRNADGDCALCLGLGILDYGCAGTINQDLDQRAHFLFQIHPYRLKSMSLHILLPVCVTLPWHSMCVLAELSRQSIQKKWSDWWFDKQSPGRCEAWSPCINGDDTRNSSLTVTVVRSPAGHDLFQFLRPGSNNNKKALSVMLSNTSSIKYVTSQWTQKWKR